MRNVGSKRKNIVDLSMKFKAIRKIRARTVIGIEAFELHVARESGCRSRGNTLPSSRS